MSVYSAISIAAVTDFECNRRRNCLFARILRMERKTQQTMLTAGAYYARSH